MSESRVLNFETKQDILTTDDYYVKSVGQLTYKGNNLDEVKINQMVYDALKNQFIKIKMLETLKLFEKKDFTGIEQELSSSLNQLNGELLSFQISTIDAFEKVKSHIEVPIDPALEGGKKKKKGIFGKLFGRN